MLIRHHAEKSNRNIYSLIINQVALLCLRRRGREVDRRMWDAGLHLQGRTVLGGHKCDSHMKQCKISEVPLCIWNNEQSILDLEI